MPDFELHLVTKFALIAPNPIEQNDIPKNVPTTIEFSQSGESLLN